MNQLNEVTRWEMIRAAQSQSPDRYEKRRNYRARDFNNVDFAKLFTDDEFVWVSRVGDYVVTICFLGAFDELRMRLKSMRGRNRWKRIVLRDVVESLSRALDLEDLYVNCSCPDFRYRFSYWATQEDCKYGDPETRPPKVRNIHNNKGYVCKHILAVLYGKRWVTAAAKAWLLFMQANPELTEYYIWGKKLSDEEPMPLPDDVPNESTPNDEIEPEDTIEVQSNNSTETNLDNDPDFEED